MMTIKERDNETTNINVIKFAHALCTSNEITIRTACNRMIAIYKNDPCMADVVSIARKELQRLSK